MKADAPPQREPDVDDVPLAPGDVVAGKYRVDGLIGRGGMGVVFAGTHLALGLRVALKVILDAGMKQAEFVARFEQEARAVALLTSPHVARVFDVGYLGTSMPYMVMELLTGETLSKRIRREPLAIAEVAQITREIGDALGEAHRLGIIHRDLKGDNVFLSQRPNGQVSAKLLDFGISKVMNREVVGDSEPLTNTRTFLGTPSSMAPEQFVGGGEVTPKTDVWSLGVLVFRMLTGVSPFHAPSLFEVAEKVVRGPAPSLAAHRPSLHPAWSTLIERVLQKDPADRPSVDDLVRMVNEAERLELSPLPLPSTPGAGVSPLGMREGPSTSILIPDDVQIPISISEEATHTAMSTSTGPASRSSPSAAASVGVTRVSELSAPPPPLRRWSARRKIAVGVGLSLAVAGALGGVATTELARRPDTAPAAPPDLSGADALPPSAVVTAPPVSTSSKPEPEPEPEPEPANAGKTSNTGSADASSERARRPSDVRTPPRPVRIERKANEVTSPVPVSSASSSAPPKPLTTER